MDNSDAMMAKYAQNLNGANGRSPLLDGKMRNVSIIRHGATKMNNDDVSVDRIRGWKDPPLTADGKREAAQLGEQMKRNRPNVLLTSDLKRAAETADIISKKIWVPVAEESQGFRPWDVGDYAGKTTKEAIPILADYAMHKPGTKVPGGESFDSFRDRFFGAVQNALREYEGHIGIVTHHRGERLMHAWAAEGFPSDGSIRISEFNKKGEAPGTISNMKIPQSLPR